MTSIDENVKKSCELAFNVALAAVKNGNSRIIPVRLFSHVSNGKPTEEALLAVVEAINDSKEFREIATSYASPSSVGEAGYVWLQRGKDWEERFAELTGQVVVESEPQLSTMEVDETGGIDMSNGDVNDNEELPPSPPGGFEIEEEVTQPSTASGARDISDELNSLRGLVDRLADERQSVVKNSEGAIIKDAPQVDRREVEALNSEIDKLRSEMARLDTAPAESRQLSEALGRQVKLEKELADLREIRSELEAKLSEAEVSLRDNKDRLGRASESQSEAEVKLNQTLEDLDELRKANASLREDIEALRIERDDVSKQIEEINRVTGGVDVATLQSDNTTLAERAFTAESELSRLRASSARLESELKDVRHSNSTLQTEKAEAAVRLSEAESLLETTQASLETYKSAAENGAVEVENYKKQSEEFNEQVQELQASLADSLEDLANVRAEGDADRSSFRRMRSERDVLIARVAEVEQVDDQKSRLISELEAERDELVVKQEELIAERGKLKGEAAAAQRENDQLANRLELLQDKIEPLEVSMLAEKHRVEELAAELEAANADRAKIEEDINQLKAEQAHNDVERPGFGSEELDSVPEEPEPVAEKVELEVPPQLRKVEKNAKDLASSQANHPSVAEFLESDFEPSVEDAEEVSSENVWAKDWSDDIEDDFEIDSNVAPSIESPITQSDDDDVDIDEISELLSRTVTDFQAISETDDASSVPSVFDSTTKSWEEEPAVAQDVLSAIRQLVSQESAVLVVDGDAVASLGWARLPVAEQRASLVTFLDHITSEFGTSAEVIFDSRVAGPAALPENDSVRIRLCQPPSEVASLTAEVVASLPPAWPCAVVSDNPEIIKGVAAKGATVYANEDLLDFISLIAAS